MAVAVAVAAAFVSLRGLGDCFGLAPSIVWVDFGDCTTYEGVESAWDCVGEYIISLDMYC